MTRDTDRNAAVLRRVMEEGFGKGNVDILDPLFHPDFREHQFGMPQSVDGLKKEIRGLRQAFPDMTVEVREVTSDGDKVWLRATAAGTHTGPFAGTPPSGRRFTIDIFDLCRFKDGQIAEHWGVPDRFALLRQIGALERPVGRATPVGTAAPPGRSGG